MDILELKLTTTYVRWWSRIFIIEKKFRSYQYCSNKGLALLKHSIPQICHIIWGIVGHFNKSHLSFKLGKKFLQISMFWCFAITGHSVHVATFNTQSHSCFFHCWHVVCKECLYAASVCMQQKKIHW